MNIAYHYDYKTLIYQGESKIHKLTGYDKCILPQFSTWVAKPDFNEETEQAKFDVKKQKWLVELKPVAVTAYHKQTYEAKVFNDASLVKDEYTLEKPSTKFDEWINNTWVTNLSKKYIHDYDQIDNVRRNRYSQICDPLVAEANIKRLQGNEAEAQELEAQALAAWQEIHDDHPWPDNPSS